MEKPPPQSAPRERFRFDRKVQLYKPIKRYPLPRTAAKEPPKVIALPPRNPQRGPKHYALLEAATPSHGAEKAAIRTARKMNRDAAQAAHVVADQIAASKERETRPSRPADGRSSKGELYEYHRQRGTLDDYYRMFPELKNG